MPAEIGPDPLSGLSDKSLQVVGFAQEEARQLNHKYIGTAHLLLGANRQEEVSAVLSPWGVTQEALREGLIRAVGKGDQPSAAEPPFSTNARRVLDIARDLRKRTESRLATPNHIFLGLLTLVSFPEGDRGFGGRILNNLGVNTERVRVALEADLRNPDAAAVRRQAIMGLLIEGLGEANNLFIPTGEITARLADKLDDISQYY